MSDTLLFNPNVPETKFDIIDQSKAPELNNNENIEPRFILASSFDKGPEEPRNVEGNLFYQLYGTDISFARHGQPILNADNVIKNGGSLYVKRVVAKDSTLANLSVIAKVKKVQIQKTDAKGQALYTSAADGSETTVSTGNTAIMLDKCSISYEALAIDKAVKIGSITPTIEAKLDDKGTSGEFTYPLFTISDNGRGKSLKRIKIVPNYGSSRYINFIKYNLEVIEDNSILENLEFALSTDIVENGVNKSLQSVVRAASNQILCKDYETSISLFYAKVAELSGIDPTLCLQHDLLFGRDKKNVLLDNIVIDPSGFNFSYIYGNDLKFGSNGEFGDAPFGTKPYEDALLEFFNGTYTSDIYDLDNHKIDLCVDANYPSSVKRALENLAKFREDFEYLRDFGLGASSLQEILSINSESNKDKTSGSYHLSYDIIDPYTKKQIPVTIGYSLCRLLVSHFKNGRNRPVSGQINNMIIPEAIEGTVNFIPKKTPSMDEKQILIDNRINYASYYDGVLTLETCYTSQEDMTQLSYINNMLAMQEVVKAVRTKCPQIRDSFIDGSTNLGKYKEDVQTVLDKYTTNFVKLKMTYLQDTAMVQNKVFYAAIEVAFKNFVQKEYFKLYAINQ